MSEPTMTETVNRLLADSLDNDVMRGVIALALFRAGIRGSGKDGLPWIVAEGVQVALVASLRHAADVRAALDAVEEVTK